MDYNSKSCQSTQRSPLTRAQEICFHHVKNVIDCEWAIESYFKYVSVVQWAAVDRIDVVAAQEGNGRDATKVSDC